MSELKIGGGLQNLGNTCFFNAVLQSVLHTKKLALHFSNKTHSFNCNKQQWCVFCEMQRTYHTSQSSRVLAPRKMIDNLRSIFKKFRLGRQQDSHQFLRYLIEGMQDAQTGKLGKQRQKNEIKIKKTKIYNIFGATIKNVVLCMSCKHKSITKERYYQLNIQCQRSNSLQQGLSRFFTVDELKGQNKYLCQSCKNRVDATKRFYLESAPQSFTFQMKRFTNQLRKIGKFIQYPKFINFGKYFQTQRKVIAKLSAVIVHSGYSTSSGHYFAYVRVGEAWFRMDDSHVSSCNQKEALNQIAYILFYQKIKDLKIQKQFDENKTKQQQKQHMLLQKKQIIKTDQQISKQKQKDPRMKQVETKIANLEYERLRQIANKSKQLNFNVDINEKMKDQRQQTAQSINCTNNSSQKISLPQIQSDDQDLPQIPELLCRRKSKQQVQQSMTLQQVLLKYAFNLQVLNGKLPSNGSGHRSFRHVYNLRKYQIAMKKRKLV